MPCKSSNAEERTAQRQAVFEEKIERVRKEEQAKQCKASQRDKAEMTRQKELRLMRQQAEKYEELMEQMTDMLNLWVNETKQKNPNARFTTRTFGSC